MELLRIAKLAVWALILLGIAGSGSTLSAQDRWSTEYAQYGMGGKLTYQSDDNGTVIPDFSHVGYQYGDEEIPSVASVVEVTPVAGDDGATIQAAIESLYSRTPDANGFRGAVLLKAGTYEIADQITINQSGIVLRGEGDDDNGTILVATGNSKRVLLEIGINASLSTQNKVEIVENYVPVGQKFVVTEDASAYAAGDQIALYRPGTSNWISDIRMDQISDRDDGSPISQWSASSYSFYFERKVTAISGDTLFFRNPVVMAMDKTYGGGFVYKSSMNRIEKVGVENIYFKSEYDSDTDEDHSWTAVEFNNVEHGWARDLTSRYFAFACVALEADAKHITVLDCNSFDPKSIITGGRRYSFYCVGQLNLFKGCTTTHGRHDYVTSSRVCGPNVYTQCTSTNAHADIGPHHRWAMGTLYDVIETDNEINVQDRDNMGSGHGWAGANQVFWNCIADASICQSPWVSALNYNFGFQGTKKPGYKNDRPDGVWVGHNKTGIFPSSLYEAQLEDRTSEALVFSAIYALELVNDTAFRMSFNLPLDQSTIDKSHFTIGGTAGLESADYSVSLHDSYKVDIVFSGIGVLPAFSTIRITAEGVRSEGGLSITGLETSEYVETDRRPVVSGPQLNVTNESGSFAVLTSTKKGYVYLIRMGEAVATEQDFLDALAAKKAVRALVTKEDVSVPVYTTGIYGGIYLMYAIDEQGRISESGDQVVIVEEVVTVSVPLNEFGERFEVFNAGSEVYIQPTNLQEQYTFKVYDLMGRLHFSSPRARGTYTVQVPTQQLMFIRISGTNVEETYQIFILEQ